MIFYPKYVKINKIYLFDNCDFKAHKLEVFRFVIGRKMGTSPPQADKTAINGVKTSVRKEIKMPLSVKIQLLNSVSTAPLVSPQDEGMSQ